MGATPLRGLTDTLAALFYPTWSWKASRHDEPRGKEVKEYPHVAPARNQKADRELDLGGVSLGVFVEREVAQVSKLCREANLLLPEFLKETPRFLPSTPAKLKRSLLGRKETIHRLTRMILETLVRKKWEPLRCQVPCGSSDARLGTAVDLVCCNNGPNGQGGDVLIELKCGYLHYLHKHVEKMRAPYRSVPDSPFWQIQLQMAYTRILYMRTYAKRRVTQTCAIVVYANKVYTIPLRLKTRGFDAEGWKVLVSTSRAKAHQQRMSREHERKMYAEKLARKRDRDVVAFVPKHRVKRTRTKSAPARVKGSSKRKRRR